MTLNADLLVSVGTALLAAVIYFVTRELSALGGVFIDSVLAALAFLSLAVFIKGLVNPEKVRFFESAIERNNVLAGIAILVIYIIVIPVIGFLAASYIFYFCFNLYLSDGDRLRVANLTQSFLISLVVVTIFYIIFHHMLGVPFPEAMFAF
jgi:hypothetical protein